MSTNLIKHKTPLVLAFFHLLDQANAQFNEFVVCPRGNICYASERDIFFSNFISSFIFNIICKKKRTSKASIVADCSMRNAATLRSIKFGVSNH